LSIQAAESLSKIHHHTFHDAAISITHSKPSQGSHNHQHRRTTGTPRPYWLPGPPLSSINLSPFRRNQSARRAPGTKVLFMRPCFCAGQGVAQRKTGCEELATNERIKSLLFPAVSPACRGERTCTKRDGLRPEQSTWTFPGSSQVGRAQGETGAVCARRARTRRPCLRHGRS